MRRPFCILNVLGDVLDDGELRFIGATKTLKAARRCVKVLGETRPGQFVIYNQQTGERESMKGGAEKAVAPLLQRLGRGFWRQYRAKASSREPTSPLGEPGDGRTSPVDHR